MKTMSVDSCVTLKLKSSKLTDEKISGNKNKFPFNSPRFRRVSLQFKSYSEKKIREKNQCFDDFIRKFWLLLVSNYGLDTLPQSVHERKIFNSTYGHADKQYLLVVENKRKKNSRFFHISGSKFLSRNVD